MKPFVSSSSSSSSSSAVFYKSCRLVLLFLLWSNLKSFLVAVQACSCLPPITIQSSFAGSEHAVYATILEKLTPPTDQSGSQYFRAKADGVLKGCGLVRDTEFYIKTGANSALCGVDFLQTNIRYIIFGGPVTQEAIVGLGQTKMPVLSIHLCSAHTAMSQVDRPTQNFLLNQLAPVCNTSPRSVPVNAPVPPPVPVPAPFPTTTSSSTVNCRTCPAGYYDGCNNCRCDRYGNASCTLIACSRYGQPSCLSNTNPVTTPRSVPVPVPRPNPVPAPHQPISSTFIVDCQSCPDGYYDGCNNCDCDSRGRPTCTEIACGRYGRAACLILAPRPRPVPAPAPRPVPQPVRPPPTSSSCGTGEEYDSFTKKCVAVSCASPRACNRNTHVCRRATRQCYRAPCPQFTCRRKQQTVPVAPVPVPAPVRTPSPPTCTGTPDEAYDDIVQACVPVGCGSPRACNQSTQICRPRTITCIRAPCPQFECQARQPQPVPTTPISPPATQPSYSTAVINCHTCPNGFYDGCNDCGCASNRPAFCTLRYCPPGSRGTPRCNNN